MPDTDMSTVHSKIKALEKCFIPIFLFKHFYLAQLIFDRYEQTQAEELDRIALEICRWSAKNLQLLQAVCLFVHLPSAAATELIIQFLSCWKNILKRQNNDKHVDIWFFKEWFICPRSINTPFHYTFLIYRRSATFFILKMLQWNPTLGAFGE